MKLLPLTIQSRLICLGVLLVLVGTAAREMFNLPVAQKQVRDLVADQQLTVAHYLASDIDNRIRSRMALLERIAAAVPPGVAKDPAQLQRWVAERAPLLPQFDRGVIVLDADGCGAQAAAGCGSNAAKDGWPRKALAAKGPVVSHPHRDAADVPVLVVALALRDAAGKPLAVLAGVTGLEGGFLNGLEAAQPGSPSGFLLVSPADRVFVGGSEPDIVLRPTPPAGANLLHDRAMAGFRGVGVARSPVGVNELTANASVPSTGWYVVVRTPTSDVFRPILELRDLLRRNALVTLAVALCIMLLVLPRLLRPLTTTAQAMRAMADGKRELDVLPVERDDEVGGLVRGFNRLVGTLRDKERALMDSMARLDQLAGTDALTGAWNRRHFHEVLPQELERAARYGHPLSLLVIDLDLFKSVNDRFGHLTGDRVLQEVADCVRANLRKVDSLTRWGGEEFVVLLPDTTAHNAALLAERIRASIAARAIDGPGHVTTSIGAAQLGADETWEQWLARADAALYRAKQAGRNRVDTDSQGAGAPAGTTDPVAPAEGA